MMLAVSLALHLFLATGIAVLSLHGAGPRLAASSEALTPPVMLLQAEQPPQAPPKPASPKLAARSATPAAPTQPLIAKLPPLPATAPSHAVALEANPNAHRAALAPEAVLSPSPPPQLNGANGIVFILDISGSMYEPYAGSTRLAFARQALAGRLRALPDGTPFAVVLYAQRACASGPLVAANNATREAAVRFIGRDVDCSGGTNLPAGFASAEALRPGALVLVTDGDLNISAVNLQTQARALLGPAEQSPNLTILGIAPRLGTGDNRLLQGLADQQGGSYQAEEFESETPLLTSTSSATKPTSATP